MSITQLILNASLVVKLILLFLGLLSFFSWYWIFRKGMTLRQIRRSTFAFEESFWQQHSIKTLYENLQTRKDLSPLERIFLSGFREYLRVYVNMPKESAAESARMAMQATYQRECDNLESHLTFLASTGSVSPYIGLFGTVWGIMHAFRGLATVQQATLAQVAPGIAEALVATALGLFAAIPALLAYNYFTREVDRLRSRFDAFMVEFINFLKRETK